MRYDYEISVDFLLLISLNGLLLLFLIFVRGGVCDDPYRLQRQTRSAGRRYHLQVLVRLFAQFTIYRIAPVSSYHSLLFEGLSLSQPRGKKYTKITSSHIALYLKSLWT